MDTKLIGITGISGVGKTTIIEGLSLKQKVNRISSTKVLMKLLGIIPELSALVQSEDYKKLESISPTIKEGVRNSDDFIIEIQNALVENAINIYEIHLVSPNRVETAINYLTMPAAEWYYKIFNGICYINASIEEIAERKKKDALENVRDRGAATISDTSTSIQKHISDLLWEDLKARSPENYPTIEINNTQGGLDDSVEVLMKWILDTVNSKH